MLDDLSASHLRIKEQFEQIHVKWTCKQAELSSAGKISVNVPSAANPSTGEALEKLKRSHNLIIGYLPECQNDDQRIKAIITSIDPTSSQSMLSFRRLTSKNNSAGKPRLIKVVFNNIMTPKNILRNKSALLSTEFKSITIRDDKTPEEICFLNSLREQLKTRKSAGEVDITIKYIKGVPSIVPCSTPKN